MDVIILGGGFCGRTLALRLLANGSEAFTVTIMDPLAPDAAAPAYRTPFSAHLLNVAAGRMSAFDDSPDDFTRWLRSEGLDVNDSDFVPRYWYGRYLDARSQSLFQSAHFSWVQAEAQSVWRQGRAFCVRAGDITLHADAVVVATGWLPTARPAIAGVPPVWREWPNENFSQLDTSVAAELPRLVIGTGLSMADTVLALRESGCKRPVHALSRGGLLPRAFHAALRSNDGQLRAALAGLPMQTRAALRRVRELAGQHAIADIVAVLREQLPRQWSLWPRKERRRFYRHVFRYWNIFRHVLPTSVHEQVFDELCAGSLVLHRGQVQRIVQHETGWTVEWRDAEGDLFSGRYASVHLATGGGRLADLCADPLWQSLFESGLVTADELDVGVCLPAGNEAAAPGFFVLGAARRGECFEQTAVPELRQAVLRCEQDLRQRLRTPV